MYKSIILSVVFSGYKYCSLILREEHPLTVSENRVSRRIYGPKGEEVAVDRRNLHNGVSIICTDHKCY
jgi:hypothetical protein